MNLMKKDKKLVSNNLCVCTVITVCILWVFMIIICSFVRCLCKGITVQRKIFKGYKFQRFCCFPQNTNIIAVKMNEQLVTWI